MLTDERKAELRRLVAEASPGPWFVKSSGWGMGRIVTLRIVHADTDSIDWIEGDYELVAAAPTAIAELLDELDKVGYASICMWCGQEQVHTDAATRNGAIMGHILGCEKSPVGQLTAIAVDAEKQRDHCCETLRLLKPLLMSCNGRIDFDHTVALGVLAKRHPGMFEPGVDDA